MMKRVVMIGSRTALDARAAVCARAQADGHEVVRREIDPATLGAGRWGRFWARRRLRNAAACAGDDGLVLLVECPGETAWQPWMVYAAGAGLRLIAVPARLKGVDNLAGIRSGVAVYERLETAADLDLADRAARAEAQRLAVAARF